MKDYHRPGYYKEYRRTHLEQRREIERRFEASEHRKAYKAEYRRRHRPVVVRKRVVAKKPVVAKKRVVKNTRIRAYTIGSEFYRECVRKVAAGVWNFKQLEGK